MLHDIVWVINNVTLAHPECLVIIIIIIIIIIYLKSVSMRLANTVITILCLPSAMSSGRAYTGAPGNYRFRLRLDFVVI